MCKLLSKVAICGKNRSAESRLKKDSGTAHDFKIKVSLEAKR